MSAGIQNRSSSHCHPQPQRNRAPSKHSATYNGCPSLGFSKAQPPASVGGTGAPWGLVQPCAVLPHPETSMWGSGGDTGSCVCGRGLPGMHGAQNPGR